MWKTTGKKTKFEFSLQGCPEVLEVRSHTNYANVAAMSSPALLPLSHIPPLDQREVPPVDYPLRYREI